MLNTPPHVLYFICHYIYFIKNYPISQSTEVKGMILWLDIHKYKSWYSIDSYLRISDRVQQSHNFLIQTRKVPCLEIRHISKQYIEIIQPNLQNVENYFIKVDLIKNNHFVQINEVELEIELKIKMYTRLSSQI